VWLERQGKLSGIAVVTNGTVVVAGADLLADILGGSLPWTVVVGRTVVWAAWKVVLDSTVGFGCGSLLLLLVPPLLLLLLLLVDDTLGVVLATSLLA